jgi:glycosyltransferase involved in cell wall biosynthesis
LRVLLILNYRPNSGGITGQILELIENLTEEGHSCKIIRTHGSTKYRLLSLPRALFHAFRSDVILGVGCAYIGMFPIVIASITHFFTRKKVVYNFHDGQSEVYLEKHHRFAKFFIGKKPLIVASKFVSDSFKKYGFNCYLIPYHFNIENTFYKRNHPFKWNKKILWARAFMDLYQPELALKAAKMVVEKDEEAVFHFYGDGFMRAPLMEKYNHPRIEFMGFVNRQDFLKKFEEYSILINTTAYDNFPLSIVEAGLNELLVFSTNIGGIKSIYTPDELAFFNDAEDLADQIIQALRHPGDFDNKRKNLIKKVSSFTWNEVRTDWLNLLKK